ncbi:MAG: tRNA dihydrouridine(20/20a) synthase DusA [Algiphilus sp.]
MTASDTIHRSGKASPRADTTAWRFCVAPMMDWTDRHCRFFLRQMSRHTRLYTEMVTTGALLHGDVARHLAYHPHEHPIALQLGGCDPAALAQCARMAEDWGYDEVNLNCGCPSDRVQGGGFGACLMQEPQRVADCVAAMRAACSLPVTVKCRIGVDDCDDEAFLDAFITPIAEAGCQVFIVHARKAWLQGISPKQNREVPPLNYERVRRLKRQRPDLCIVLNGGLTTVAEASEQLAELDGVMLGRAAYDNPWLLAGADPLCFGTPAPVTSRREVLERMRAYIAEAHAEGTPVAAITRHMLGLYRGQPRGRAYRRLLGESARSPNATAALIDDALALLYPQACDADPLPAEPQENKVTA